jgi:predicted nucleic acid-binding protein
VNPVLLDSNVLLDVLTENAEWYNWSADVLERLAEQRLLIINPIVYAEVSIGFDRIEDLDDALPVSTFRREPIPYSAAFLAAKAFLRYRRRGGSRTSTLPDFFIGAHAAIAGFDLLTRDPTRYRTYFPTVTLITPR